MSKVIQFLESIGRDGAATQSAFEYAAAVRALNLSGAEQDALLRRDPRTLNDLLGGRVEMMALLLPESPDDAPQSDTPSEEAPDDGQEPQPPGIRH